jgi:hypothetical protein
MTRVALVNLGNGQDRAHDSMCRDLAKDLKEFRRHNPDGPDLIEADSIWEIAVHIWADVASDNAEADSPEWVEAVWENDNDSTEYQPCVKLPRGGPERLPDPDDLTRIRHALGMAEMARQGSYKPADKGELFITTIHMADGTGARVTAVDADGAVYDLQLYGLSYGKMADFVRNNKPEE